MLWPDRASKAVAESLRRFAGMREPDDILATSASKEGVAVVAAPAGSTRDAGSASGVHPSSLRDLSDRMADVLRTQALQHGIDLT
jgi:hypothetical protein